MKKLLWLPKLVAGLIVGASAFCGNLSAQAVPVTVQLVDEITMSTQLEAVGDLVAYESITITPVVSKTISELRFDDGDRVKAGQILVEMANAEEKALLTEAKINLAEAERQLNRLRGLKKNQSVSQAVLDAQYHLVESLRARVDALSAKLNELIIKAPFSGQVGLRQVSLGAFVSPGSEITTLVDDTKMKLDFSVPATHLPKLSTGMPIRAKVRALGDKEITGEIISINNQIDVQTRSVRVRALVPNPNFELKQGMLTLVEIDAGVRTAIAISEAALVPLGGNNFVFVIETLNDQTLVKRRAIKIGERLPGIVEVLEGLQKGEKVVTHGLQRIRDGQPVQVTKEQTSAQSPLELQPTILDQSTVAASPTAR